VTDSESSLGDSEIAFLQALIDSGIRFLFVGVGAAVAQGADTTTKDLDFWFERQDAAVMQAAAAAVGGFYATRTSPPSVGGGGLDRIDLVMSCSGLDSFADEYARAVPVDLGGIRVMAIGLDRIIESKAAANRPKDVQAMPALKAALAAVEDSRARK